MTPDFDKIQPGMTNGLNKVTNNQREEKTAQAEHDVTFKGTERTDMGTGVAGRSSVKMDNIDTDMRKFFKSPRFAIAANKYVEHLVEQGYNYEDAIEAVWQELGV